MNNKLNPARSLRTLTCSLILSYLLYGTAGYVSAALAVHFFDPSPLVQVLFVCLFVFLIKRKLRILFM